MSNKFGEEDDLDAKLSLEDALTEIRKSLLNASKTAQADGQGAVLYLQGAELEIKFAAGTSKKAGGKFGAKFWVVNAGAEAGGEVSKELVHTLKLQFRPSMIPGDPVKTTSDRPPSGVDDDPLPPFVAPRVLSPGEWPTGTTFWHDAGTVFELGRNYGMSLQKDKKGD